MALSELPSDLLGQLRSAELRRYATATGWERNAAVNGRVAVFQHPTSDLDQLVVPAEGGDADAYAVLIGEAVRKLATWESRPPGEVLSDLLLPPADVLRFRTIGPESAAGDLPLEHAVQLVTGVRRLLSACAHSAIVPRPYHPRLSRGEAEEFVGRCRVGQTERGSFTLAVACPLDLPPPETLLFDSAPTIMPFPRRVTELLMQSLRELADAADLGRVGQLVDTAKHPGLSANFCEALLLLRPTGDRSLVGVSPTWSRMMPVSGGKRTGAEVELRQEAFEAAEYLAPTLRTSPTTRHEWLFGYVDELRGGFDGANTRPSGEVWLSVVEPDGHNLVRARTYLSADQYAIADAAHMTGSLVSMRAALRRLRRVRAIEAVSEFAIVRPDDIPEPSGG